MSNLTNSAFKAMKLLSSAKRDVSGHLIFLILLIQFSLGNVVWQV